MNDRKTAPRELRAAKKSAPSGRPQSASSAVRRALRGESVTHDPLLSFGRANYLFMAAGAVLAVLGFVLLRGGDISLAPVLLVLGYCALIPLGIIWRPRARTAAPEESRPAKAGE